ncbi:MAG TPA: FHA domain-containing protein [Nannocystaceae bacterium]|nr:FHA domain-containing protein [Nannocystaceae bacterium]
MMVEITVFDRQAGESRVHRFSRAPVQIGRDPGAEICLPHAFVSSRHAVVSFADERAELVDLGSTNGTFYAGRPLPPNWPLAIPEEVVVSIGRIELRIRHLTGTAEDAAALAQIHAVMRRLRPLHVALQEAQASLSAAYQAAIAEIPNDRRALAEVMIAREMPECEG